MHNQRATRTMVTSTGRAAPQSRNCRVARAKLLSQLAFLSLLTFCGLVINFTVHAQDSANQEAPDSKDVSGFLGDYSRLVPDPKNGDLLIYEKDRDVMRKYYKFMFDPVTIYLLPEAQNRGIDADDLDRLAIYFRKAVTDELEKSGRYQVVNDPGPDVLELNVAITNVEPTGGKRNAAVKGAVTAATVGVAPGTSLLVPRLSVGKVGIEGEILDSVSGDRLVAFVTGKGGRRWFAGFNSYKKWGDIDAAFRFWAKDFRQRLDELHGS